MNLTQATSVTINGKEVKKIQLNGQIVYELINIQLTTNKQHIITGETVNINLTSNVINKEVELFKVIGLTKTKIETLTTDENGQASYTYTGTGAGNVSFVAVYDNKESNTVQIDDYVPAVTTIELATDKSAIISGQSVLLTATVKDQHGELIPSGTVTFKENGVSIGTGSVTSGVATLTVSNFNEGTHSIIAEVGNVVSNSVNVNVLGVALTLGVTGGSFISYNDSPFTYTGAVSIDWGDGTTEAYTGGCVQHNYDSSGSHTIQIFGNITGLNSNAFLEAGLNSVAIGSSVTSLGENCFRACQSLTSVTLANSVTTIGEACFGNCNSLTSITLPDNVTSIGGNCFIYCDDLTEIVLEWNTASSIVAYDSTWIGACPSFDHFLIPEGTTALYEAKSYPSALLVEETPFDGIDLESDKDIISYNGGTNPESATLTAKLTNGGSPVSVSGETVTFEVRKASDDSLVETLTADTDSSGIATVYYLGKGTGDLYIKCFSSDRIIFSKTYSIQDIAYYNSGASVGSLVVGSGVSCTSNGSFITITTSTTGEKYVRLPVKLDGNWEYSIELAEEGVINSLTFDCNNGSIFGALADNNGIVNLGSGTSSFPHSTQVGDVFTLTYINGTLTFYVNGNQKASRSVTLNTACGMYTNQNRIQKVKNIKLKQL